MVIALDAPDGGRSPNGASARPDRNAALGPTCIGSDTISREARYLLHNRTPGRIHVKSNGDILELSPLSQRVICGDRLEPFQDSIKQLRQSHKLSVRPYEASKRSPRLPVALVWLAILTLLVIVATDLIAGGTLLSREALVGTVAFAVIVVVILAFAARAEGKRRKLEEHADIREGDIDFGVGAAYYDGNETLRRTTYIFTFLVVVLIGAVLPAVAIFVATDAKDFLAMNGGLRVLPGKESRLVARLIQVVYTAVLALFPALLYFQFDRQRVGMIRGAWVRSIFRMDRRMETLSDVNARYGDQLSDASSYSTDTVRFLGGRHSPIIVATILLSLGWTILVIQTDSFDFAGATRVATLAQTTDDAAQRATSAPTEDARRTAAEQAAASSREAAELAAASVDISVPAAPTTADSAGNAAPPVTADAGSAASSSAELAAAAKSVVRQPFFQLLVPTPTAAAMAFLGAYFFGMYLVLRGYFRGDLRPKIYNQITARLVTVVVLAYLISALFSEGGQRNRYIWALSFLAGVVPTTVLQQLGLIASSITGPLYGNKGIGKAFAVAFATPRPLTDIDGIDLQEASRLESEGIPDIPALAQMDLVTAMVNTRLPVERLVDWTDQAVLMLHLDAGRAEKRDDALEACVSALRAIGVRTASSVLAISDRDPEDEARQQLAAIVRAKNESSLELLVAQIEREPAMGRILQWHLSKQAELKGWLEIECDECGRGPASVPDGRT